MNFNDRYILIDLSQEIYEGMPVYGMHQKTFIMVNQTHGANMAETGSKKLGFSARNLLISEHGPTHSDAVWEYKPTGATIDEMDLKMFYGDAICIDLSHIRHPDYITSKDIKEALNKAGLYIKKGDVFLIYTGHFKRTYPDKGYAGPRSKHSGLSLEAAEYLAANGVVNIGVDAPAIDLTPEDLDFSGHFICGKYNITNTENLRNLDKVVGMRFIYLGLPLLIRKGSGSPIRAVALIEREYFKQHTGG